jgi:hypothetical protein
MNFCFGDVIVLHVTKLLCLRAIRIRPEAEKYGVCKIVPPTGWKPPDLLPMNGGKIFPTATKIQPVHRLQEGQGFDDGKRYTLQSYKAMADEFYTSWMASHHSTDESVTMDMLAKDYWDMVETNNSEANVEYGNDLDTSKFYSGFPARTSNSEHLSFLGKTSKDITLLSMQEEEYYRASTWNLNNMPSAPGSLLQYLQTNVNGINVPWLYCGMLFSTFCWHTEDNYFYSINYSHKGAVKQWYGVPGSAADKFEKVNIRYSWQEIRGDFSLTHRLSGFERFSVGFIS